MSLTSLHLLPVYNHGNCPDLLKGLYEPLLAQAVRYDRTTYTFTAEGLIAAAAGAADFVRNGGHIRLICDHSVRQDVLQAIHDGQLDAGTALQQTARREDLLLTETADIADRNHLELAYWLVANGIMEVKVAIRGDRIFHNKSGIVEDSHGNRVAFAGSLNETLSGWRHNWESVDVYTESEGLAHLEAREREFQALWTNQATGLTVIDLPALLPKVHRRAGARVAARDQVRPRTPPSLHRQRLLARHLRRSRQRPRQHRCHHTHHALASSGAFPPAERGQRRHPAPDCRRSGTGQNPAGRRHPQNPPEPGQSRPRLDHRAKSGNQTVAERTADEVRHRRARHRHAYGATTATGAPNRRQARLGTCPFAIAGHQWLVRNAEQFLATCGEYDIIIVDEAHRARFRDVDLEQRRQPNQYLRLLSQLSRRTRELLLLTATPMQLNEVELWALLGLLEPEGWNAAEYRRFYQDEAPRSSGMEVPPRPVAQDQPAGHRRLPTHQRQRRLHRQSVGRPRRAASHAGHDAAERAGQEADEPTYP